MASNLTALNKHTALSESSALEPLQSQSLFLQADFTEGGPVLKVLPFLFWIIEKTAPAQIVSFDAPAGEAYFGLCQAIRHLSLETQAFSVTNAENLSALTHINDQRYSAFSTLLSVEAEPVVDRFSPQSVDLLFVDLTALPTDLHTWCDKLSPRCVVILHGATDPDRIKALRYGLSQLNIDAADFTLDCGNGLAVSLGPEAPSSLRLLFQTGMPGHAEAYQAFHRLGQTQVDAYAARAERAARRSAEIEAEDLRQSRDTLALALKALEEKHIALERAYAARGVEIDALKSESADADEPASRTEQFQAALRLKDQELNQLRTTSSEQIAALDRKCTWLRKEVAKKTTDQDELAEARARVEELEVKCDRLAKTAQADRATASAQVADLKDQLETRIEELVALTQLFEKETGHLNYALRESRERFEIEIELRDAEVALRRAQRGRFSWADAHARFGHPSLKDQIGLLTKSKLFDADWYQKTYPDVASAGISPERHYVLHGALDGRNPGPEFDTMAYYRANRDVSKQGMNALVHYELFGRVENRPLMKTSA